MFVVWIASAARNMNSLVRMPVAQVGRRELGNWGAIPETGYRGQRLRKVNKGTSMDNSKGRYWDKPWGLISSCTRCSEGCRNCWALGMEKRFHKGVEGQIVAHPERLDIPLRTRKPTVFAVWNDILHDNVNIGFLYTALDKVSACPQHTFLFLTKRAHNLPLITHYLDSHGPMDNLYLGVTVCNQAEADAKIPELLKVPGKRWLSIEPMLSDIDLRKYLPCPLYPNLHDCGNDKGCDECTPNQDSISCVVCGGETGPGARPLHPGWIRNVRDQCAAAGVDFYFKQWGEWGLFEDHPDLAEKVLYGDPRTGYWQNNHPGHYQFQHRGVSSHGQHMLRVGSKRAGRILDGRTHDELPWRTA
jgi:protein gp37